MSIGVFLMVLCAAAVHATWNALVKSDEDRLGLIRVMFLTQFAFSLSLVPFVVLPDRESWPYLCASAVLGAGYMVFLNWAYRVGDLSHGYPFARGIAPLIVAIVSTAFLGEQISEAGKIPVVLIALGIASLALTRGAAGLREPRPIFLSFIAGGFCRRVHYVNPPPASFGVPNLGLVFHSLTGEYPLDIRPDRLIDLPTNYIEHRAASDLLWCPP